FLEWRAKPGRRNYRRERARRIVAEVILPGERAMLDSVRGRLTVWYTGFLALFLVLLSLISYFIFWRSTLQRTDNDLAELSEAFLSTVRAEVLDLHGPDAPRLGAQEAITEHHYSAHVFAVADSTGGLLVSSQDLPGEAAPAGLLASERLHELLAASDGMERQFRKIKWGRNGY